MPKIIFLEITTNTQKITSICQYVQKHFDQGDSILILAPSEQAMLYIDEMLWKYPEASFLPHTTALAPIEERIVITTLAQNLNNAKILINLCSDPSPLLEPFETIYELYDKTHPEKFDQSKRRHQDYLQKGIQVTTLKI